jgi:hypothetical protein
VREDEGNASGAKCKQINKDTERGLETETKVVMADHRIGKDGERMLLLVVEVPLGT